MGWENVFHCEWNEFGKKVLKHYWPNAESFDDITKTDFTKYEGTIDIISGGFPCQPFSTAGQRKGTEDERYLWGEMLRAIQEIKPEYVVAENVFGITTIDGGLVFNQVCVDLENEGYEVQPFIIPACAKNAPHRRDRCWFIAQNTMFRRCLHGEHDQKRTSVGEFGNISTRSADGVYLSKGVATNSKRIGHGRKSQKTRDIESREIGELVSDIGQHGNKIRCKIERCGEIASNTNGTRQQTFNTQKHKLGGTIRKKSFSGNSIKSIYPRKGWENFPTQSPICGGDDGLPTELDGITFSKWRNESLKAYGNAIVPQVAYEIFKAIEQTI
jgi:DNA (cytosine-5)-methyltransferase 1